jgi:hypothetical protein
MAIFHLGIGKWRFATEVCFRHLTFSRLEETQCEDEGNVRGDADD